MKHGTINPWQRLQTPSCTAPLRLEPYMYFMLASLSSIQWPTECTNDVNGMSMACATTTSLGVIMTEVMIAKR